MVVVEAVLPVGLGHGMVVVVVVVATVWLREYRMQKSKFDVALIYELQKKNRVEAVLLGFSHTKSPFRLPQNKEETSKETTMHPPKISPTPKHSTNKTIITKPFLFITQVKLHAPPL